MLTWNHPPLLRAMQRTSVLWLSALLCVTSCNVMKQKSRANERLLQKDGHVARTFMAADGPHYTWTRNSGRPKVLFLHGYPGSGAMQWAHLAHLMSDTIDAIIPDLLCHGHSTDQWRPTDGHVRNNFEAQVAHVVGLLDSLGIEGPVTVVGNSYGGGVAAWLAYLHPERVSKLIISDGLVTDYPMSLADSVARTVGEPSMLDVMSFRDWKDVRTIVHLSLFHKVPVPGSLAREYFGLWVLPHQPAQATLLEDVIANERSILTKRFGWPMPTYLIWGERDDLIPNSVGLAIMTRNGLPADHWYTVPKAGHVPMLEKPHAFETVLRSVLSRP